MTYVRPILLEPDPRLHKRSKRVGRDQINNPIFQQTIDDMIATCRKADGVGLAGVQIGFMWRVFVMADPTNEFCFINPRLTVDADERLWIEEGCLSKPGFVCQQYRYTKLLIEGWDRRGKPTRGVLDGLAAQCAQHECDHLEGILVGDRDSRGPERRTVNGGRIHLPA